MRKHHDLPSQERLQELLTYSVVTGAFYWRTQASNFIKVGDEAGGRHKASGYWFIKVDGVSYKRSRLVWRYVTGEDPGDMLLDHFNRDKSNDAWHNLRLTDDSENNLNRSNVKHRYIHYHKRQKRWLFSLWDKDKKTKRIISRHLTLEEAIRARDEWLSWH